MDLDLILRLECIMQCAHALELTPVYIVSALAVDSMLDNSSSALCITASETCRVQVDGTVDVTTFTCILCDYILWCLFSSH